jgi:hypothetical protein
MPKYKVQKLVALKGRTASGQANRTVGAVWETIAKYSNKSVAERVAQHARVDNPNNQIRIDETSS